MTLEQRILRMSQKWNYSVEELVWAMQEARRDPEGWTRLCNADEQSPGPHHREIEEAG